MGDFILGGLQIQLTGADQFMEPIFQPILDVGVPWLRQV